MKGLGGRGQGKPGRGKGNVKGKGKDSGAGVGSTDKHLCQSRETKELPARAPRSKADGEYCRVFQAI